MTQIRLNLSLLRMRIHERYGTQAAFARHCGWSRQYVSRILGGQSAMSMERLGELAGALELNVNDVIVQDNGLAAMQHGSHDRARVEALRELAAEYATARSGEDFLGGHKEPEVNGVARLKVWPPVRIFASEEERLAYVRSLRGKYRDVLSSSEEFLRRKHEETEREESAWDSRT